MGKNSVELCGLGKWGREEAVKPGEEPGELARGRIPRKAGPTD